MAQRREFVELASAEGANVRELCRRFGISSRTGYKWLTRFQEGGAEALSDRSRRPRTSPGSTEPSMETLVLELRAKHPAWGGRKLRVRLLELGHADTPAASTITQILRRHNLIDPLESLQRTPPQRFEHPEPNDLWQMDYKGHVPTTQAGRRCHPLTVLDDHSRYCVGLRACVDERAHTVRTHLTDLFRLYGLPRRILSDNGSPWGAPRADRPTHTELTAWLLRLGVGITHGRPHHPQTQGKDERFHRTLKAEVLREAIEADAAAYQQRFDRWRVVYNHERPHESCGMRPPASRYRPSVRAFPETLPPIEYGPGDTVRKVQAGGEIHYRGQCWPVGKAFHGEPVAVRPTNTDGLFEVFYCRQRIRELDLRRPA